MGCPLHFYDDDRPRSPPFISYPFRTAHHLLFSAKVDARMGCVYARFTKDPDRSRVHFYYLKNFVRQKSRILATGCRTDRTPSSNLSLRIRSYLIVKRKKPRNFLLLLLALFFSFFVDAVSPSPTRNYQVNITLITSFYGGRSGLALLSAASCNAYWRHIELALLLAGRTIFMVLLTPSFASLITHARI